MRRLAENAGPARSNGGERGKKRPCRNPLGDARGWSWGGRGVRGLGVYFTGDDGVAELGEQVRERIGSVGHHDGVAAIGASYFLQRVER